MNIIFKVIAESFQDAAALEELLDDGEYVYETVIEKEKVKRKASAEGTKRPHMDMKKYEATVKMLSKNPQWHSSRIAKEMCISLTTVNRIKHGTHALSGGS